MASENSSLARQWILLRAGGYERKAEIIDTLMIGIEDRRAAFITYQSAQATEPVTYDIYPYGLTYHRGSLYLIGHAPDHDSVRHWKVDRIEAAETTEFRFLPPEGFNLQYHLAHSFGIYQEDGDVLVKVHFSAEVGRYVQESTWHASQQLVERPDGSLIAEFYLGGTREIKTWILSFGRHAEVLEPEELREEMAEEISAMAERCYCDNGRKGTRASPFST